MVIKDIYPVSIVKDRYGGVYSGGRYVAFHLHPEEIPEDAFGGDTEAYYFWENTRMPIGKGSTPNDALYNLYDILKGR